MSSTSGRDISMTSKEICSILEASKGTFVKEIKVKDLVIKFDNLTNNALDNNNSTIAIPSSSTSQVVREVDFLDNTAKDEQVVNEIVDEYTMANLMVNDPEAYEKRQREL